MTSEYKLLKLLDELFENCWLPVSFLLIIILLTYSTYKDMIRVLLVNQLGLISILLIYISAFIACILTIISTLKTFPTVKDTKMISNNVIYYQTVSFCVHPKVATKIVITEIILLTASTLILVCNPQVIYIIINPNSPIVFILIILSITLSMLTSCFIILPIYFFSPVFGFRVGNRLVLVCTGYSDAEVISSEPVKVRGFVEKHEFPVENTDRDDLTVKIGYFKTGIYTLKPPDRGFFFLRTRGICVLRDDNVPLDDKSAFESAREWEKFSMVYAALCLKNNNSPSTKELNKFMKKVKNNCQRGLRVRYLGVPICLFSFTKDGTPIGAVGISYLVGSILKFFGHILIAMILISPIVPLILNGIISFLPTIWIRKLNKKAVVNCKWYNMILNRDIVKLDLYRFNDSINNNMFEFKKVLRKLNKLDL